MSDGHFISTKTQYYVNDGFGRDTYIYNINGGFSPEKLGTRVHEVGKKIVFYLQDHLLHKSNVQQNRLHKSIQSLLCTRTMEVDVTLIFLRTMEVLDLYIEMDMEKALTTTN